MVTPYAPGKSMDFSARNGETYVPRLYGHTFRDIFAIHVEPLVKPQVT